MPYEINLPLLRLRWGHLPRQSNHFCWGFFCVLALETPLVTLNKSFWETRAPLRVKPDPLESYSFSKGIRNRKHVSNSAQKKKTARLRRVVRAVVHCAYIRVFALFLVLYCERVKSHRRGERKRLFMSHVSPLRGCQNGWKWSWLEFVCAESCDCQCYRWDKSFLLLL